MNVLIAWSAIFLLVVLVLGLALAVALSGRHRAAATVVVVLVLLFVGAALARFKVRARVAHDLHGMPSLVQVRPVPNTQLVEVHRPDGTTAFVRWPASLPATTQSAAKRWVDDWPGFVNSLQSSGGLPELFIRAESKGPCVSESEARQEAIADAARQLEPVVLARATMIAGPMPLSEVEAQVLAALRSGRLISDQHLVRTDKSYGSLWTCSLLVDRSPLATDPIVQRLIESSRAKLATGTTQWLSVAALTVVVVLLYAFLNAATKGYFVWRLRAVALLALIAAVLAVLTIA
jgi:hypothetical protein